MTTTFRSLFEMLDSFCPAARHVVASRQLSKGQQYGYLG